MKPKQAFPNISLRLITEYPRYIPNSAIQNYLKIQITNALAILLHNRFSLNFTTHKNPIVSKFPQTPYPKILFKN